MTEKRKAEHRHKIPQLVLPCVDKFDSPDLNDAAKVPSAYRYHGEIEGLRLPSWSATTITRWTKPPACATTPRTTLKRMWCHPHHGLHTAMALPSPYFQGIYTTDDVKADTDFNLATAVRHHHGGIQHDQSR